MTPPPPPSAVPVTPPRPGGARPGSRRSGGTRPPEKFIRFGQALGAGLATWARNLVPITMFALVAYSPVLLVSFLAWTAPPEQPRQERAIFHVGRWAWLYTIMVCYGYRAASFLLSGIVALLVHEQVRLRRPGPIRVLARSARGLLSLLWALFLTTLILGACLLPITFILGLSARSGSGAMLVLFLALGVPYGLLVACLYAAAPQAVVARSGRAVLRSFALTRGHRGTIFGLLTLFFVVERILEAILILTLGQDWPRDGRTVFLISLAVSLLFAGPRAAIAGVVYDRLRQGREGVSVEQLEAVFD